MAMDRTSAQFETTNWNLVNTLTSDDPSQRATAARELMLRYWPPVYAWMRRHGLNRADAEDATQAFFTDVVVTKSLFESADDKKAGLRNLLRTCLSHFAIDQYRRQSVRQKSITISSELLDIEEAVVSGSSSVDVNRLFDERWAVALVHEALRRCELQFRGRPSERYWQAFERYVLWPAATGNDAPSQSEIAIDLNFKNGPSVAVAIQTVRLKYQILLQQVIAETALDPDEIGTEYAAMMDLLG